MLKVYSYKGCSTCRKAEVFLKNHGLPFDLLPIRETPPERHELDSMLDRYGEIKFLFNRSGKDYRELKLKDKLPVLSQDEQMELLRSNGNLVKRPFILKEGKALCVGFDEAILKDGLL